MINFNKNSKLVLVYVSFLIGLASSATVFAATDPGLGSVASFSVLGQTSITGISTISGDVGMNNTGANITALTTLNVAGVIYATNLAGPSEGILLASVQADASTAFTTNIPGQAATASIGPVLDTLTVTPGVYDIGAGRLNGGVLHLNGSGIYIFRASSDLVSSGSISLENGARACDVYWRVQTLATINGTSFAGTILAGTGVHFGAGVNLDGRALAVGGDVTMLGGTISGPSCATPTPAAAAPSTGGVYSVPWVSPSITVTKVPTPLALPLGSGTVIYDYTVLNSGTIPLLNVTVTDDKCTPVSFISGDTNIDSRLDINEVWKYSCTTILSQTTTNTVTATGQSTDGLTAIDTDVATVIVDNPQPITATATVIVSNPQPAVVVLSVSTTTYPTLPDTGITPNENNFSWSIITVLTSFFILSLLSVKIKSKHLLER